MSEFSGLLTQTVTYADVSSRNNAGDPVYGSQVSVAARVEFVAKRVLNAQGIVVDSVAKVYTATAIPHRARIWLPGDDTNDDNEAKQILKWEKLLNPSSSLTLYGLYL